MPTSDWPPANDRRKFHRYELWFPVTLDVEGRSVWSICRDVSRRGILVSARQPIEEGMAVTVRFRTAPTDKDEHAVDATVVRCEQNPSELVLAFPWRLAIQFVNLDEALGEILERAGTPPDTAS